MDLWSREAARQDRREVVELLEVERLEVMMAIERAAIILHLAEGGAESMLRSVSVLGQGHEGSTNSS